MAENRIKLIDPNGQTFMASTPTEINSLVFGAGYKLADKGTSVDAAIAKLAEGGPVHEQLAVQNPPVQADAASKK